MSDVPSAGSVRAGVAYGVAAYLWWGVVTVVYFKVIREAPPPEMLAHRIVWSVCLLAVLMRIYRRWDVAFEAARDRRTVVMLLGSTTLITVNWFVFIISVVTDRVLEASLGYFINPLFSVLLGVVFLKERLRRWQMVSVLLAGAGVVYLTVQHGKVPWIALVLAVSFGLYGLLRKTSRVDSLVGLTMEVTLLLPLAFGYLVYLLIDGTLYFGSGTRSMDVLLILGGVVTAVPLLWFANAARRLRLATVGFLQYIAPTMQLLAGIYYGESFTRVHAISFGLIWTALLIYSIDAVRASRANRNA